MRARRADGGALGQRMRRGATRRGVRAVPVDSFMVVGAGRRCRDVASRSDAISGDGCVLRRQLRFGCPFIARRASCVANACGHRRRFGEDRRAIAVTVTAQPAGARDRNDRHVRIGATLHSARRGAVPTACASAGTTLHQPGFASRCATVARSEATVSHTGIGSNDAATSDASLHQQNRQIAIHARRFGDALDTNRSATTRSELQLAPRQMTSRHHVAAHRDAYLRPACIDAAPAPAHPASRSSASSADKLTA